MRLRRVWLCLLLLGCGGGSSGTAEPEPEGSGGEHATEPALTTAPAVEPAEDTAGSVDATPTVPPGDALLAALIEAEALAQRGDDGPAMEAAYRRAVAAAAALGVEDAEYYLEPASRSDEGLTPVTLTMPPVITGADPASRCAQARIIAWERWRFDRLEGLTPAQREPLAEVRGRLEREPLALASDANVDRALDAAGRDGLLDDLRRECESVPPQWDLALVPADLMRVANLLRGRGRATGDFAGPFRLVTRPGEQGEAVANAAAWGRIRARHQREADVGMGFTVQAPMIELDAAAYEALSEREIEALSELQETHIRCEDRCCTIQGSIELMHGGGLYLSGACWVPAPNGKRLSRILFLDGM